MNKWSLIFNNSTLEDQYQKGFKHLIRKQVFIGAIASLIVIIGQDLIGQVLTSDYFHFIFDVIFIGIALIGSIIAWKKQYLIKYALITINFVIAAVQFQMDPTIEQQYNYIFGQCTMASHMIIIATSDFRQSLLQILGLVVIRIIIMYIKTTTMNIQMYCFMLIVMLFQIYVQYISDLAQRKQFLLHIKENHWEKYLPNLIRKPFYLFHFQDSIFHVLQKNEQLPFVKLIEGTCDGCNLRSLLRKFFILHQTLEEFLVEQQIKLSNSNSHENQINTEQKIYQFSINQVGKFQIIYQEFVAERVEHILILDEFIPFAQSSKQQKQNLKCFIRKQISLFADIIKHPSVAYDQLILQNINLFSQLTKNNKSIFEFDFIRMVVKLKKLMRVKNLKIHSHKSRLLLVGQKHILFIYLAQIFQIIKHMKGIASYAITIVNLQFYVLLPEDAILLFFQQLAANYFIKNLDTKIQVCKFKEVIEFTLNEQIYQLSESNIYQ